MTKAVVTKPEEAITQSEAHINDFFFRGGADTEAEDVEVGEKLGVGELIKAAWANAKANVEAAEKAWLDHASSFLPKTQLLADKDEVAAKEVAETKPSRNRNLQQAARVEQKPAWRRLLKAAAAPKPATQPEKEEEKETDVTAVAMEELKQTVAGIKSKPDFRITILSDGEKKERIAELAEIFQSDKTEERLRYNTRKAEVAEELEVQQMDVHRAVMHYLEKEKKEKRDLTQSQKVVSLVLNDSNVHLWVDPSDRTPYVSIIVNKHCENYRLGDGAFETWVRAEYGRRHWTEVDGRRTPAVMSSVTLHEGIVRRQRF